MLSTVYQFGYRIAALAGGALALFLADWYSWPVVYALMGGLMLAVSCATFFAPDTEAADANETTDELREAGSLDPKVRAIALSLAWYLLGLGANYRDRIHGSILGFGVRRSPRCR